jgi:pimeloyl-ACP methyl ester carboxylesterase
MGADENPLAAAHRVRAPTLVLIGGRDPVVPRDYAEALTAALPHGRLEWVEGAAHALIFDDAEGVVGRVVEWVKGEE